MLTRTVRLVLLALATAVAGRAKSLVVLDNDWNGSGGYVGQTAVVPLLVSPSVELLGLGSVSGDNWRDEGLANVLRFLEEIGVTSLPVTPGAVFPLLNSRAHLDAWEAQYGKQYGMILWKGAWNPPSVVPYAHADNPYKVEPVRDGPPRTRPSAEDTAHFMIRMVHEHPHEVTIYEAGPMTNLALAVRLDPQFAPLAKELVFMGGYAAQTSPAKGYRVDDFNILFDPEAAQITLGAGWARIVSVADATDQAVITPEHIAKMKAQPTRATAYLLRNSDCKYPIWDETGSLLIADPTLITRSEPMYMRAVTEFGPQYGGVVLTPVASGTAASGTVVTVVEAIDAPRTMAAYVAAMTDARFR